MSFFCEMISVVWLGFCVLAFTTSLFVTDTKIHVTIGLIIERSQTHRSHMHTLLVGMGMGMLNNHWLEILQQKSV